MSPELITKLNALVDKLSSSFGAEQCKRLRSTLAALAVAKPLVSPNPLQKPRIFFIDGLPEKPWYEPHEYPELARISELLESAAPALRAEYVRSGSLAGVSRYASSDVHGITGDDWSGCTLWDRGRFTPAADLFPETSAVIERLSADLYPPSGEVVFLRLRPGASVPAHHDATNAQLTCHLGIAVPQGCGIRVGAETRGWQENRVLFFDHSFEHEVWNRSTEERVVLLLNILHPALTQAERVVLKAIARVERASVGNNAVDRVS